jgi:endonuclease/exonuclease/phosphatase family metal-dependent hydrolase
LKAKRGFEDKRLEQGEKLLHSIKEFIGETKLPVVIAGDFNDEPTSIVYKLFASGKSTDSKSKVSYKSLDDDLM